ncbi:capsule-associated protein CAP1 [Podochytrium sp. JEL0797]|nr:capsule-associated protein CAP1 [Podochytrium sp. JEL0797]
MQRPRKIHIVVMCILLLVIARSAIELLSTASVVEAIPDTSTATPDAARLASSENSNSSRIDLIVPPVGHHYESEEEAEEDGTVAELEVVEEEVKIVDPVVPLSPLQEATKEFEQKFSRPPPPGFVKWHAFATQNGCFANGNMSLYSQIFEKDLKRWRDRGGIEPRTLEPFREDRPFTYEDGKFVGGPDWFSKKEVLEVIAPLFEGGKEFSYVINTSDEPRLIPADIGPANRIYHRVNGSSQTTLVQPPTNLKYHAMNDIFHHNECFRKTYDTKLLPGGLNTAREVHGFFLRPDTFHARNYDAPVISGAKIDCYVDVLMPLHYHQGISMDTKKDNVAWEDKANVLFWRGSTTGGSYRSGNAWSMYHRTLLLDWEKGFARQNPGRVFDAGKGDVPDVVKEEGVVVVDVGLNAYPQTDDETRKVLERMYPVRESVNWETSMKFKYLVVVDGNSWSGRIQLYLESNSVVLWNGLFVDWYLVNLVPWVHYVPFALDYSDLEERMEWLVKNDEKARQISVNARELMRQMGRISQVQCYSALLLLEYRDLYNMCFDGTKQTC